MLVRLATTLASAALIAAPGSSQCLDAILTLPNPKPADDFGQALDRVGDRILVGAPGKAGTGRAYVYERQGGTWIRTAKLAAAVPGLFFGYDLDLDVDRLAVGDSAYAQSSLSSVYLFSLQGGAWAQSARVLSPDGLGQGFGADLALEGDRLAVGAIERPNGTGHGSVYVFERQAGSWTLDDELLPVALQSGDGFGTSVDMEGDRLVAGAPTRDTAAGAEAGQIYVWEKGPGGWTLQHTLEAAQPAAGQHFGFQVDLDGDRLLVHAFYGDTGCGGSLPCDKGGVYVWEFDGATWNEVERIAPGNPGIPAGFGRSVSMDGGVIAVNNTGYAPLPRTYVLRPEPEGWREVFTLPVGNNIGARKVAAGSVLVQDFDGVWGVKIYDLLDPVGASYCSTPPNSTGLSGRMHAAGSLAVGRNCMTIAADRLPPQQPGYLLLAPNAGFVANPGGSQGNLCLGAGIGRFDTQVRQTGGLGSFSITVDLTDIPASPGFVAQGSTWYFQAWYRDLNPGPTSNFTDGLSILFL